MKRNILSLMLICLTTLGLVGCSVYDKSKEIYVPVRDKVADKVYPHLNEDLQIKLKDIDDKLKELDSKVSAKKESAD